MKIAFIDVTTTVFFGGIQTAVWQLAIALADLGHEITIYGGDGPIRPDLCGRNIVIHTYPFRARARFPNLGTRFRKLAERVSFALNARKHVFTAHHDWIILTKPFDFFWPHLMPGFCATRFAFMSGGTDFILGDRYLAGRIDALVACSHFNAQQNYNHFKRMVKVIFNGVDVDTFTPRLRNDLFRQQHGLSADHVVFFFAGRLVGWKGLSIPIRAMASPLLADLPVRLLIVGNGEVLSELKQLADRLGQGDRVIFHAGVAHGELPDFYANADVGIFPSLGDEAFGISVAEAMASGLPVVTSYSGGMPEVVGNEGSCGELFALGDAEGCANAMERLARDSVRRSRMGKAARERILSYFTWRQAAERLLVALKITETDGQPRGI